MGRSSESTDYKGTSQLDSYCLCPFYYMLSTKRFVRMATCIYQSAYRMYYRARGDKRKNGKWRGRQDGCNLLWQSSKTLGCVRGRNQDQRGHVQLECTSGIFVFYWQPTSRIITDWKNRRVACNDSSLADTGCSAYPVI